MVEVPEGPYLKWILRLPRSDWPICQFSTYQSIFDKSVAFTCTSTSSSSPISNTNPGQVRCLVARIFPGPGRQPLTLSVEFQRDLPGKACTPAFCSTGLVDLLKKRNFKNPPKFYNLHSTNSPVRKTSILLSTVSAINGLVTDGTHQVGQSRELRSRPGVTAW